MLKKNRIIESIIWLVTYSALNPILRLFFSVEVAIHPSLLASPPKNALLIANHKSMADPWIIPVMMPVRLFINFSPIRFTGATRFNSFIRNFLYRIGIIPLVYFLYNVIKIPREGTTDEKLLPFKEALLRGETAMFFPEGSMIRGDAMGEFKRGSAALAHASKTPIVPISIRYKRDTFRTKCFIRYGAALSIPEELFLNDNPHFVHASEYLRKKIEDMYQQNHK
ncbi:MAG: 1-acyl-sn-glycerol-3-phosphate acyltransferase [Candidatus Lloydbacteria bacterium]|nr:1-acyl-sn-glycerol-3-phosphate acyltransferase [Candidatus Lloydbacteria bacterium]